MNPTDLFKVQKTQQAMRALEDARMRGARERTLLALALVVSRVQVNHLVRPVPSVQAAMVRLRSETTRHAAKLAAEQVTQYESEPRSQATTDIMYETMRACRGVFPREAALLQRALGDSAPEGDSADRSPASGADWIAQRSRRPAQ
jgi:hypothetical protein